MKKKNPNDRPFDLLVYGVGFTGTLVAEYLAAQYAQTVRFALGGRSREKLEAAKRKLIDIDPACSSVGILIADAFDGGALEAAVKQASAVVSTVGPFQKYGMALVGACVRAGTHYADITGEPNFVLEYTEKYNEEAKRKGVMLVSMCGFDSIPSDLGALMVGDYLSKKYHQPIASIKMSVMSLKGKASAGTIRTIFTLFDLPWRQAKRIMADPYALNPPNVRGEDSSFPTVLHYDKDFERWQGPFFMSAVNQLVVRRSNGLTSNTLYGPNFRYEESFSLPNILAAALFTLAYYTTLATMFCLATFPPTNALLWKFLPDPGTGPTREEINMGSFYVQLIGETEPKVDGTVHRARGHVKGKKDPGYGETAKMLTESGLALALDRSKLPGKGGSLTPAVALGHVLIERLRNAGLVFDVEEI